MWHKKKSVQKAVHEEMGKRMVARLGQVCLGETPPISDERPPLPVTTYTDLTTDNITINWDGVSHVNNIVSYEIMRDVYVIDTVAPTERSYITGWDVEIGEFQIFSVLAVDEYGNRSRHKQGGGDQAIRP